MKVKKRMIETPVGEMVALADDRAVVLLEFVGRKKLEENLKRFEVEPGSSPVLEQIERELEAYFRGELGDFRTPIKFSGTQFQEGVWESLRRIPVGETWSYRKLAESVGNARGCRAVAQANGANQLAIVVPCHRVINADGRLGGYAGGLEKKQWLLAHEKTLLR